MALMLAAPEFRAATRNQRTAQMKLIMGAHPELVDDVLFQGDFETEVRTAAATEVARHKQERAADDSVVGRVAEEILRVRTLRDQRPELPTPQGDGKPLVAVRRHHRADAGAREGVHGQSR